MDAQWDGAGVRGRPSSGSPAERCLAQDRDIEGIELAVYHPPSPAASIFA